MNQNPLPADASAPASLGAPQNRPAPGGQALPGWQFTPYTYPAPKPREPVPAAAADGVMALFTLLAAWLFLRLVTTFYPGLGVTLFTMGFVALVLAYRQQAGLPLPRQSLPWLGVMFLSSANFALLDNGSIAHLNIVFLVVVTAYWLACLGGTRVEDQLGGYLLADLRNQLFVVPFQNFGCLGSVAKGTLAKTRLGKNLVVALLALVCSLPLLWYVCGELAQVEAGFGSFLEELLDLVSLRSIFSTATLLSVPLGCYLYGLIYGNQHKRYTGLITAEKLDQAAVRRRVLPPAAVYTLLTLLCLVYALFFAIGAAGFLTFLGSTGLTPYDYSQFARQGFFELCRVSVVNLLVLWGIHLFLNTSSQRSTAPTRVFHTILCCQTLLLIALALCKMGLYIHFCGVTWLRVCTSWFMVLLAAVFGLTLLAQFRKIPLARWIAASFCILFLALCYMNVDGLVVKSAVWRYENLGDASAFTDSPLYAEDSDLGPYAVAGAAELRGLYLREIAKPDTQVLPELERLLARAARTTRRWDSLSHWNLQRIQAASASQGFLPPPAQPELPPLA